MFGIPVIGREGNANDYLEDGVTGVLVTDAPDMLVLRSTV
jgi:hypothetical protein